MTEKDTKDAAETPESEDEMEPTTTATVDGEGEEGGPEEDGENIFIEEPSFDIDYKGECAYEVKVSIPPANRAKQAEEMFEELRHEAEVPGFRKGKVPRKLLERKFSKAVRNEVDAKLVSAAFQKLCKDHELRPIATPEIDGLQEEKERSADEPLALTFKFEVSPRVELGKYRGIDVERPVVTIDDKDIEEQIESLRARYAVYNAVSEGTAQEGDQVIIDFEGKIDGVAFAGGSAEAYPYILGTKRFFPEFETALAGAKVGQETSCDVTFPDDYNNEQLRGKTAHFTIHVKELKRRELPELNDEFAKQLGSDSVAELRASVAERMRSGAEAQSTRYAESNALETVIAGSSFEIPQTLIESSTREAHENEVRRLLQMRIPMADIREREAELMAQAREQAIHNIKAFVVLNEIIEAEGLEVTEEDFDKEAEDLASRLNLGVEVVSQYLQNSEERSSYENRILRSKAMDVIMQNAHITDKEIPHEEEHVHGPECDHDH